MENTISESNSTENLLKIATDCVKLMNGLRVCEASFVISTVTSAVNSNSIVKA